MMEFANRSTMHKVFSAFIGLALIALLLAVFWRGSAPSDHGTVAALGGGVVNDAAPASGDAPTAASEIPPSVATTCTCPTLESGPVRGAISSVVRMGQISWEGNTPYTFSDCAANAQEVLDMMQDADLFDYAKSLTRAELGAAVPTEMWYTWDRNERYCKFYLSCPGLTSCDDVNTVSGMLKPRV